MSFRGADQGGSNSAAPARDGLRGAGDPGRLRASAHLALPRQIDIRWNDLDGYGHVNQAIYVTYGEESLDAWFRERLELGEDRSWDYVAAKTTIEYRSELRIADGPAVATVELVRLGTKSVTTRTTVAAADGRIAAELENVVVAIDGMGGESRALTDQERTALTAD
ncbi:MAG TPA: thioesterase family protein [Gaiellaceae bacterium]|nr:thioesterase family protein [Gaiellaceae bacterium]